MMSLYEKEVSAHRLQKIKLQALDLKHQESEEYLLIMWGIK